MEAQSAEPSQKDRDLRARLSKIHSTPSTYMDAGMDFYETMSVTIDLIKNPG